MVRAGIHALNRLFGTAQAAVELGHLCLLFALREQAVPKIRLNESEYENTKSMLDHCSLHVRTWTNLKYLAGETAKRDVRRHCACSLLQSFFESMVQVIHMPQTVQNM